MRAGRPRRAPAPRGASGPAAGGGRAARDGPGEPRRCFVHKRRKARYGVVMFRDALRTVVENTEGGMAGLLMDFEGIPVDSYTRDGAPFDIDQVGAEFSVVVKSIRRAAESLEAGATHEVAILSDRVMTVIRVVNRDYFLALAMEPGGNVGKGRYLLRTAAPAILRELE